MDFVVVGFGLGALGVLLGVVMLGLLAPRSQRAAMRAASPHDAAHDLAVAAEHRGTGQAFLYAGAAMLLATVGGLAGALDDRTGALLVTTTATVAVIGILLGGYLHRVRNPAPPRRGARPAAAAETSGLTAHSPVAARYLLAGDVPPGVVETAEASVAPHPASGANSEAAVTEDAPQSPPPATGEPAAGAPEPDPGADPPVAAASPGPEHGLAQDEEEEAVGIGFVAPTARATRSPSARPDEGEDPS